MSGSMASICYLRCRHCLSRILIAPIAGKISAGSLLRAGPEMQLNFNVDDEARLLNSNLPRLLSYCLDVFMSSQVTPTSSAGRLHKKHKADKSLHLNIAQKQGLTSHTEKDDIN